ncbi:hypothetical protein MNBD_ALPHA07-804 [hydrothermal vent metagenome]|uniref:Uncharacterized protein n=1 Tax=hydrothermal vent metagenome TaxID=652676 RepID=A0A3B0SAW3_9ZZZZ
MTLMQFAIILSGLGVVMTALLSVIFLRDPKAGLVQTTHRLEKLPQVMTDRYIAMTVLAAGATLYRDMAVIAVLFASFAFMAFADAWIYARSGHPFSKHIGAGIAASLVVIVALMALRATA